MAKTTALAILGLRGAQNPHVLYVHCGSCAPCAPKLAALTTFLARFCVIGWA